MLQPTKIKNALNSCIKNMSLERDRFIRNPKTDFTRKSKCDIETTAKIILGFENSCLNSELKNYFRDDLSKIIYKSTFVQQRSKFSQSAFHNLFYDFNAMFPFHKKKFGLRILAVDGSDINIPTLYSDKKYFVEKHTKNGEGYYQIHLNAVYDILEDRFIDSETQPRAEFNEGAALNLMVDRAPVYKDYSVLYIADRNYATFNVFAHISNRNQYYLIRCKDLFSRNSAFKKMSFPSENEFDVHKHIKLIRSLKNCYKNDPENYKCLSRAQIFDFIDPFDRDTTFDWDFRMVSILLPDGKREYLITNLPTDRFPASTLKELYRLRWNEETAFHKIKYKCGLNWFHSIKRDFVMQEIFAKLLMYNFTSLLTKTVKVQNNKNFKHEHQISFANTAKIARMYLTQKIAAKIIKTLILMESPPVRDNRFAPRIVRSQTVNPLNTRV